MPARFVNVDRETPMLLPPDLSDWVAKDDLARFVLDAVQTCDLSTAHINHRGSGSAQYPPGMMLALLIYSYAHRLFSSRQIEAATYHHLSLRYLCGNRHPDHDTIATFRRQNAELLEHAFVAVLLLARELKAFGQLGTVSVDGTKLGARATRNANRQAGELETEIARLQSEMRALLAEAEAADRTADPARETLAPELHDKQKRCAALQEAHASLQARQHAAATHHRRAAKGLDPEEPGPPSCPPRGTPPEPPNPAEPTGQRQARMTINLSEPESRLMRDAHGHYLQAYNAQFVVEAGAARSQLILAARLSDHCNDRQALETNLARVPEILRREIDYALLDTGYDNADMIARSEKRFGLTILCPPQTAAPEKVSAKSRQNQVRRQRWEQAQAMRARLREPENQARYRRRSATVEPVIGVLKNVLGFRRFRLFGLAKAQIELTLLALAYNLRRLAKIATPQTA